MTQKVLESLSYDEALSCLSLREGCVIRIPSWVSSSVVSLSEMEDSDSELLLESEFGCVEYEPSQEERESREWEVWE